MFFENIISKLGRQFFASINSKTKPMQYKMEWKDEKIKRK